MAVKVSGVEVIDNSRNITTNVGTVDGRDIAADGAKLDGIDQGLATTDSPTFAGGTFNGNIGVTGTVTLDDTLRLDGNNPQILIFESDISNNHRILASSGNLYIQARDSDGTDDGRLYLSGYNGNDAELIQASAVTFNATGNITVGGTVDGRDIATDGTKLDGIEAGADVTDATNVTAAGALMDSELTDLAGVKALDTSTLATLTGTQTLTNKTLTDPAITGTILEDVYTVSGTTPALDPSNGSIQTWTLTGNSTPTDSLSAGEAITIMIDDGTAYTITWPTTTWINNAGTAPTLATTGYTVVALWKVSTTLYGALVGDGT